MERICDFYFNKLKEQLVEVQKIRQQSHIAINDFKSSEEYKHLTLSQQQNKCVEIIYSFDSYIKPLEDSMHDIVREACCDIKILVGNECTTKHFTLIMEDELNGGVTPEISSI